MSRDLKIVIFFKKGEEGKVALRKGCVYFYYFYYYDSRKKVIGS